MNAIEAMIDDYNKNDAPQPEPKTGDDAPKVLTSETVSEMIKTATDSYTKEITELKTLVSGLTETIKNLNVTPNNETQIEESEG